MKRDKITRLADTLEKLARDLGLDEYDEYTIQGAGGLVIAEGKMMQDGVITEVVKRYTLDGETFFPDLLNKEQRQKWVKVLKAMGQTQMSIAKYLDVSQSLISRDLHELGLR